MPTSLPAREAEVVLAIWVSPGEGEKAGSVGKLSELAPWPAVQRAVVEVAQPVCEPYVPACGEQLCHGTKTTQDVPCGMGVGEVDHAGGNPCTCASMKIEGGECSTGA